MEDNIFLSRPQYGSHQFSFSEMEAQLQEQQSRDKEIKAVNETLKVSLNLKFCVSVILIALLGDPGGGRIVKGEVGGVHEHLLLL